MTGDQWRQLWHQQPPHPQSACSEAAHTSALKLGPHPDARSLLHFAMQRFRSRRCLDCLLHCQFMGYEVIVNAVETIIVPRRTVPHLTPSDHVPSLSSALLPVTLAVKRKGCASANVLHSVCSQRARALTVIGASVLKWGTLSFLRCRFRGTSRGDPTVFSSFMRPTAGHKCLHAMSRATLQPWLI